MFVHLHNHTEYSIQDAIPHPKELALKAKELNMPAVAITDHGNMFGAVEFFKACKEVEIKPIIGCEMYFMDDRSNKKGKKYHIVLLAKDEEGYRNLSKLVTIGNTEGFYYTPRIDWNDLQAHSKGLIVMTACIQGIVNLKLLLNQEKQAYNDAKRLKEIFGEDFYMEVQWHNLREDKVLIPRIKKLAKDLGIKVVPTNDVHYLEKQDYKYHKILYGISRTNKAGEWERLGFPTNEFYFKSYKEMFSIFDEDCKNTLEVAEKCNFEFDFDKTYMPKLFENSKEILRKKVYEGVEKKYGQLDEKIKQRIEYELEVINKMGYADYFLIVEDFVRWAKNNDIFVGPGRGSAAGSIVAYLLDITDVDPLKYKLLFERFLNPQRVSMPDIDIDFEDTKRNKVLQYTFEKYGYDKTACIITFDKMAARQVIRDVGRSLGRPIKYCDLIAKNIGFGETLTQFLERNPFYMDPEHPQSDVQLFQAALKLENRVRNVSVHAAGVVISSTQLTDIVPLKLQNKNNEEVIVTQYSKDWVEALGLLKMDFLGLETLSQIRRTINLIKQTRDIDLDIRKVKLDDENVWKLISSGKTTGVFQLESDGIKNMLRKMKPNRFEDLIAAIALYRPGPLMGGMVDEYIARKNGEKQVVYEHEVLKEILEETYGVIVYQEQVMQIANKIAGFSLGQADILRRAMGKKKKEVMESMKEEFVKGAVKNGFEEEFANRIFELISNFAQYGFNKSHSAAYAFLSYWTAFLKTYYKEEFFTAILSLRAKGSQSKFLRAIKAAKEEGIQITLPDVNKSDVDFKIVEGKIIFGLGALKNVGSNVAKIIVEEREKNGEFKDLADFVKRIGFEGMNKKAWEALIKSGALDCFGYSRKALLDSIDYLKKFYDKYVSMQNATALFGNTSSMNLNIPQLEDDEVGKLIDEKEILGVFITAHPFSKLDLNFEKIKDYIVNLSYVDFEENEKIGELVNVCGVLESKHHRKNRWDYVISDETSQAVLRHFSHLDIEEGSVILAQGVIRAKGIIWIEKYLVLKKDFDYLFLDFTNLKDKELLSVEKIFNNILKTKGNKKIVLKLDSDFFIVENIDLKLEELIKIFFSIDGEVFID